MDYLYLGQGGANVFEPMCGTHHCGGVFNCGGFDCATRFTCACFNGGFLQLCSPTVFMYKH